MSSKKTCLICESAPAAPGLRSKFARLKIGKLTFSKLKKKAKPVQRCRSCEADMGLASQFSVSLKKLPETLKALHSSSLKKFGAHWEPATAPKPAQIVKPQEAKVVRGTCKRCKRENRKLRDWLWRDYGPQQNLWCAKCRNEKFWISFRNGQIAHKAELKRLEALAAQELELGIKNGTHKRALAKNRFKHIKRLRSLATEGNVPLMKRLLKEGKKFKELIKIYTELYKARGQTNEKWILARVKTYKRIVEEGGQ